MPSPHSNFSNCLKQLCFQSWGIQTRPIPCIWLAYFVSLFKLSYSFSGHHSPSSPPCPPLCHRHVGKFGWIAPLAPMWCHLTGSLLFPTGKTLNRIIMVFQIELFKKIFPLKTLPEWCCVHPPITHQEASNGQLSGFTVTDLYLQGITCLQTAWWFP